MQTPVMLQNTRMLVNFECREGLCDWRWFLNIQSNKQTKKRNPSLIAPVSPFGSNYYYKLVAICFIQKRATFCFGSSSKHTLCGIRWLHPLEKCERMYFHGGCSTDCMFPRKHGKQDISEECAQWINACFIDLNFVEHHNP